jgi:hypothetical protein
MVFPASYRPTSYRHLIFSQRHIQLLLQYINSTFALYTTTPISFTNSSRRHFHHVAGLSWYLSYGELSYTSGVRYRVWVPQPHLLQILRYLIRPWAHTPQFPLSVCNSSYSFLVSAGGYPNLSIWRLYYQTHIVYPCRRQRMGKTVLFLDTPGWIGKTGLLDLLFCCKN